MASEWALSSFTTTLFNSVPQLTSPVNGATLVSVTPILQWNSLASTATYTVYVSMRPDFSTIIYSKDTTGTSLLLPTLQRATAYYWRVRAQTPGDTTAWSSARSFTTLPNAPNSITLIYPDSGKQDSYRNDWLMWQADYTATAYLIQISQSPLFVSIFDSATVMSVGYRNTNKVFTSGSTYFWRVRGSNTGGDGPFSSVWSFRIGSAFRMPLTSYSTPNFAFGNVMVGQYRDTTVTISNTGNDTLKIASISSSNAAFSVRPTNKNVPPGQSFVDTIRFTPNLAGTAIGKLLITSNAASSPDTVSVSGTGVGISISGTVCYGNAGGFPIRTVNVTLTPLPSGNQAVSASDSLGAYVFTTVLPGSYSLTANKGGAYSTPNINAADALKAALYSIDSTSYPLSAIQKSAADVNGDGSVNSADALQTMLRYVGSISAFAKGAWVFLPSASSLTVATQNVTIDVVGLAVGDVNGDAQPTGAYFGTASEEGAQTKKMILLH